MAKLNLNKEKDTTDGDTALPSPKKECFGYFMNPVGNYEACSQCPDFRECYDKWKELGEPTRTGITKVCPVKYEQRCKQCEGI